MNSSLIPISSLPCRSVVTCYGSSVSVEKVQEKDYGSISELIKQWLEYSNTMQLDLFKKTKKDSTHSVSAQLEIFKEHISVLTGVVKGLKEEEQKECLVCRCAGKIQALAIFLRNGTYLDFLVTNPSNLAGRVSKSRFKGGGTAIMDVWKKWLNKTNQTGLFYALRSAVGFYLKVGCAFVKESDSQKFIDNKPLNRLCEMRYGKEV